MMTRKLRLLLEFLRALPGEIAYSRRAVAYRRYLATRFPTTIFGAGCLVSDDCLFSDGVWVGSGARLSNCTVGRYSYISGNAQVRDCAIGDFCSLGPEVLIGLGVHPLQYVSTYPGFYALDRVSCRTHFVHAKEMPIVEHVPIVIGNDVWIGARAIVRDGVTIGHGAAIGAGALVVKDVAPYSIVGGVPARIIRMRFSDDIVARLLELRWWDRPLEWIDAHASDFMEVESLLKRVALETSQGQTRHQGTE